MGDDAGPFAKNSDTVNVGQIWAAWSPTPEWTFTGGRMPQENLARYKEEIKKNFNFAVMENETKWPQWANEASRPGTLATIDWLRENGLQVRGHNLVWPSWRNTNVKAATDARENPAALFRRRRSHGERGRYAAEDRSGRRHRSRNPDRDG